MVIDREEVFRFIGCDEESESYQELADAYNRINDEIEAICEPIVLLERDEMGLLAIYSIGKEVSKYSTEAFQRGDYLEGFLADVMADVALFSLEEGFEEELRKACEKYQVGIAKRLEADVDFPIELTKTIWEKTNARANGIEITSGYMLDPPKSYAVIYETTSDQTKFFYEHDCGKCSKVDCKFRKKIRFPIRVRDENCSFEIEGSAEKSILETLMEHEKDFVSVCGGTGKCGKCKIQVIEGNLAYTGYDEAYFSVKEISEGWRLACHAYPRESVTIKLGFEKEESFNVITKYEKSESLDIKQSRREELGIAIDLGTTTIALQLISLQDEKILGTDTRLNHQRRFGADVISRISASIKGEKWNLMECIRSDITAGIMNLLQKTNASSLDIRKIVVSGNTTMVHLLMGCDCTNLGTYPFTSTNLNFIEMSSMEILHQIPFCAKVSILPGIAAFVGGDIVAGIYQCEMYQKESYSMFIDLGTNGEIAIGNCNRILVTSTAAGPAFEGGNISYGVGSVKGAISHVEMQGTGVCVKTIGEQAPIGICGTGVIEAVAEGVRCGKIDESGYMEHDLFLAKCEGGTDIVLTQKDIREFQLAKSAIRAGIEALCISYGVELNDIESVYLAGGFGYQLNCKKAMGVGLFPKEFEGKICAIGNSSLGGAVKYLCNKEGKECVQMILDKTKDINLSADKNFMELYMRYMYFE